jgi:hypothetical protein
MVDDSQLQTEFYFGVVDTLLGLMVHQLGTLIYCIQSSPAAAPLIKDNIVGYLVLEYIYLRILPPPS